MFAWLANVWRVPELRRRLLFTAGVLAVYRFGSFVPAPGVDQQALGKLVGGGVLGLLNPLLGLGALALLALRARDHAVRHGVDHLQVLAVVVPSLERLQKEGEAGYAKITQYTRYLTIALAAAQATGYAFLFKHSGALHFNAGRLIIIILTLTGGTALLMWMGEQITKRGIGNGISILIFASILA
jgi:preprotein translocase subunit SecY